MLIRCPEAFSLSDPAFSASPHEMLQSLSHLSGPSVDLLQYAHVISGSPELDPALHTWSHED